MVEHRRGIAHLLRRTEFVARPERVDALSSGSIEAAVHHVLDVARNGPTGRPFLQSEYSVEPYRQYQDVYHGGSTGLLDLAACSRNGSTLFCTGTSPACCTGRCIAPI